MVHGEGWKVEKPEVGTVAYHDSQWVSYDDVSDIQRKVCFHYFFSKINIVGFTFAGILSLILSTIFFLQG